MRSHLIIALLSAFTLAQTNFTAPTNATALTTAPVAACGSDFDVTCGDGKHAPIDIELGAFHCDRAPLLSIAGIITIPQLLKTESGPQCLAVCVELGFVGAHATVSGDCNCFAIDTCAVPTIEIPIISPLLHDLTSKLLGELWIKQDVAKCNTCTDATASSITPGSLNEPKLPSLGSLSPKTGDISSTTPGSLPNLPSLGRLLPNISSLSSSLAKLPSLGDIAYTTPGSSGTPKLPSLTGLLPNISGISSTTPGMPKLPIIGGLSSALSGLGGLSGGLPGLGSLKPGLPSGNKDIPSDLLADPTYAKTNTPNGTLLSGTNKLPSADSFKPNVAGQQNPSGTKNMSSSLLADAAFAKSVIPNQPLPSGAQKLPSFDSFKPSQPLPSGTKDLPTGLLADPAFAKTGLPKGSLPSGGKELPSAGLDKSGLSNPSLYDDGDKSLDFGAKALPTAFPSGGGLPNERGPFKGIDFPISAPSKASLAKIVPEPSESCTDGEDSIHFPGKGSFSKPSFDKASLWIPTTLSTKLPWVENPGHPDFSKPTGEPHAIPSFAQVDKPVESADCDEYGVPLPAWNPSAPAKASIDHKGPYPTASIRWPAVDEPAKPSLLGKAEQTESVECDEYGVPLSAPTWKPSVPEKPSDAHDSPHISKSAKWPADGPYEAAPTSTEDCDESSSVHVKPTPPPEHPSKPEVSHPGKPEPKTITIDGVVTVDCGCDKKKHPTPHPSKPEETTLVVAVSAVPWTPEGGYGLDVPAPGPSGSWTPTAASWSQPTGYVAPNVNGTWGSTGGKSNNTYQPAQVTVNGAGSVSSTVMTILGGLFVSFVIFA